MTNNYTMMMNTPVNTTERFSLILLEPGEIYFEDYLVYYHSTSSPLQQKQQQATSGGGGQKGKLKICSKSIVFEPADVNYPVIKFPLKSIERISDYTDLNTQTFNDDLDLIKKHYFYIQCKQLIKLKENNKIAAYTCERVSTSKNEFYFQFIFTNVTNPLHLMHQLYRANTLPFDEEEIMINSIVKSCLLRIKFNLSQLSDVYSEQILVDYEVYKIQPLCTNPGKVYLTNLCLYYKPFNNLESETVFKIKLNRVRYLIKRRYKLHKNIACEILYDQGVDTQKQQQQQLSLDEISSLPCLYLTFNDEIKCNDFYEKLKQQLDSKSVIFLNDSDLKQQENMLQKWRYGIISNYEYLMYLNLIADRSFNDLTQYPVYPWVLVDYKSTKLDLDDESIYRDLSKPIGALNEERLERLKKRYLEIKHQNEHKSFLYGSHYSTPAFVLYYLVREYPEWQLCLQNGKFDQSDRLFYSIADTWRNCYTHDSDVKELIPEFYDLNSKGKFLLNHLKLDFGMRQDSVKVDDVVLPRWCNNDAGEFIKIMRDALESTYVSKNLHLWIDLIFGYKQRGVEAEKANNLFYYLCYEGAIDLESIRDQNERKSIEIQIQEFGQIPTQLFKQPHAARIKYDAFIFEKMRFSSLDLTDDVAYVENEKSDEQMVAMAVKKRSSSLNKMKMNKRFCEMKPQLSMKLHKNLINDCCFICLNDKQNIPFLCSVGGDNWLKIYSIEDQSIHRSHNLNNFSLSSIDYIQLNEEHQHTLLLVSSWDNSVYVYDINYSRCIYTHSNAHDDAVSRISVFSKTPVVITKKQGVEEYSYFVLTSSWDSLIKIWKLSVNISLINNEALGSSGGTTTHIDSIRMQFYAELCHDTSILDFKISPKHLYLASLCDDSSLLVWKFNSSDKHHFQLPTNYYSFTSSFYGQITDCQLIDENHNNSDDSEDIESTIAFCTKDSVIKIMNIKTKCELFSLNLNTLLNNTDERISLTKLCYDIDYIVTIDSSGCVYFIDLNQTSGDDNKSSYLSNRIKLCSSQLQCLSLFNESIVCTGDAEGNLYLLSFNNI